MILCRFVEKITAVRALQSDLATVLGKAREADFAVQKLKPAGAAWPCAVRSLKSVSTPNVTIGHQAMLYGCTIGEGSRTKTDSDWTDRGA